MMTSYDKIIRWPISIRFWETGRIYAKGRIEDGLRQGMWTFYYRTGAKQMEGLYKDGVQQGLWTKWWPNGNITSQGGFDEGWMHGTWIDYFDNGEKAQESHWDRGRITGTTTVWKKNTGKVLKQQKHKDGKEERKYYPLMSNRDTAFAMATAQKMGMKMAWTNLVGEKIAQYLEPWQCALWVLLFVPAYALLEPRIGWIAVPAGMAGAAVIALCVVVASVIHDSITRPDIGISRPKPKD
ncbi:MAG: hypothetical protein JEZ02_10060 [Desulfatibacillum sp.]|nr:hypothetical protein [Desulfatibacillum sp.]